MIRQPAVAGRFYPETQTALKEELRRYIPRSGSPKRVIGIISPHAGYMFSGSCAGKAFGMVEVPETVIILGVDHHGYGCSFAVDSHDHWRTPLGDVKVDKRLRSKLVTRSMYFKLSSDIGRQEHSLEVQVPFIQYLNPKTKILPIVISSTDVVALVKAGEEIAELIKEDPGILTLASTDMSHFIDVERAKKYDYMAVKEIKKLSPDGLFNVVQRNSISMCGVAPTTMMLAAARQLGATKTEEVEYTNSGFVSGNMNEVVAYLSMLVY